MTEKVILCWKNSIPSFGCYGLRYELGFTKDSGLFNPSSSNELVRLRTLLGSIDIAGRSIQDRHGLFRTNAVSGLTPYPLNNQQIRRTGTYTPTNTARAVLCLSNESSDGWDINSKVEAVANDLMPSHFFVRQRLTKRQFRVLCTIAK
jgi:hypothetical protein